MKKIFALKCLTTGLAVTIHMEFIFSLLNNLLEERGWHRSNKPIKENITDSFTSYQQEKCFYDLQDL